jgi:hypothetical protein
VTSFGVLFKNLPTFGPFTPSTFIDSWRELRDGISAGKLTIPYERGVEFDIRPIRCFVYRFDIFLDIVSLDVDRFDAFRIPFSRKKHLVIIFCRQWLANLIRRMMGFCLLEDGLLLPFPLVFSSLLGYFCWYRFWFWFWSL